MKLDYAQIIKSAEVFRTCTREERENILIPSAQEISLNPGDYLFKKGDSCEWAYIVVDGKLKESWLTEDNRQMVCDIDVKGNICGFESILTKSNNEYNTKAITSTMLIAIPAADVRFLTSHNTNFCIELIKYCCHKLKDARQRNLQFLFTPIRQRVAKSLLYLQDIYSDQPSNSISARRKEIAYLAGSTRESTTKLIKEFEQENLLTIKDNGIIISDPEGLSSISNMFN